MTRRQLLNFLRLIVAAIIAALVAHLLNRAGIPHAIPAPTP